VSVQLDVRRTTARTGTTSATKAGEAAAQQPFGGYHD
jgi:hypothetical protein